jgi:D-glycero-D-manno-heptose 1,7-bisphosphate phosphatase
VISAKLQPAVFLDRDGTLIREVGYLCRPDQIELLDGVAAAIRALRDGGFKTVMVTNQSAVARGWLSEAELKHIHRLLLDKLAQQGALLDAIYYCPHHPSEGIDGYRLACDCRKPNPGMIHRAANDLALAPNRSYVVGDQNVDRELALRVGATPVLVRSNGEQLLVDPVAYAPVFDNLGFAAQWILTHRQAAIEEIDP